MTARDAARTKFFVLTGFLGSGKTTLLRGFLGTPDAADTAVIVNEAGEIGLDGAVLAQSAGGLPIAQLANGCVCCGLGSDLAWTVDALIAGRAERGEAPFRRIVLETSGISKPGPILRALAPLAAHRMPVEVVATFDCVRGTDVATFAEAAAQWAGAHTIVPTKRDVPGALDPTAAAACIAGLNPLAAVANDATAAFSLARAPGRRTALACDGPGAHPRIRVVLARQLRPIAWDDASAWLDNLAGLLGERLLRVKGVLDIADQQRRVLVQAVGTAFASPAPFAGPHDGDGFLVLIGRDIEAGLLEQVEPVLPWRFGAQKDALREEVVLA